MSGRGLVRLGALWIVVLVALLALAACGSDGTRDASEVRALFAGIARDGRARHFSQICNAETAGVIRQLEYLVGGNCPKDLARDWREGVYLTRIAPQTRIAVDGHEAVVYDGPTPDRARRIAGRWLMSELPRNARHAMPNEAQQVLTRLNSGFRAEHMPMINPDTGVLER